MSVAHTWRLEKQSVNVSETLWRSGEADWQFARRPQQIRALQGHRASYVRKGRKDTIWSAIGLHSNNIKHYWKKTASQYKGDFFVLFPIWITISRVAGVSVIKRLPARSLELSATNNWLFTPAMWMCGKEHRTFLPMCILLFFLKKAKTIKRQTRLASLNHH